MFHRLFDKTGRFLKSEDGPTAVEYAVLLAMMVGMMMTAIMYVGFEAQEISDDVVEGLDGALNGDGIDGTIP